MSAFSPQTVNDLNLASKEQLIEYLEKHKVSFGETALKPELLSKAREHFTEAAAKEPGATQPKLTAPSSVDESEALKMLQTKGFKDKDELVHYINALERKESEVKNAQIDVDERTKLMEKKEIEFTAREEAIQKEGIRISELNNENDRQLQELKRVKGIA